MFILDTNDVDIRMFVKGQKVEYDIYLWHKRIGHINFKWLEELQAKHIMFVLPNFSGRGLGMQSFPTREATSTSFRQ